jgi:hypothetical protein
MISRSLTLDQYADPPNRSQDPRFLEVQQAVREAHPGDFLEMRGIALRLAADSGKGGFTVEDLRKACEGFGRYGKNLPGVVLGHLRSKHALCVIGRQKATHPAAKGRWINRFKLNSEAIEVDEGP